MKTTNNPLEILLAAIAPTVFGSGSTNSSQFFTFPDQNAPDTKISLHAVPESVLELLGDERDELVVPPYLALENDTEGELVEQVPAIFAKRLLIVNIQTQLDRVRDDFSDVVKILQTYNVLNVNRVKTGIRFISFVAPNGETVLRISKKKEDSSWIGINELPWEFSDVEKYLFSQTIESLITIHSKLRRTNKSVMLADINQEMIG